MHPDALLTRPSFTYSHPRPDTKGCDMGRLRARSINDACTRAFTSPPAMEWPGLPCPIDAPALAAALAARFPTLE